MAPSVDEVREAIEADGYCDLENDTIGKPFDELVGSGFHIQTKPGMELCRRAIFRNEVSMPKSAIETCVLTAEGCTTYRYKILRQVRSWIL